MYRGDDVVIRLVFRAGQKIPDHRAGKPIGPRASGRIDFTIGDGHIDSNLAPPYTSRQGHHSLHATTDAVATDGARIKRTWWAPACPAIREPPCSILRDGRGTGHGGAGGGNSVCTSPPPAFTCVSVDDGKAASVVLRWSESAGQPRTGYVAVNELAVDNLAEYSAGHLGGSPEEREQTGCWPETSGRQPFCRYCACRPGAMFPDPVSSQPTRCALGFKVSNALSVRNPPDHHVLVPAAAGWHLASEIARGTCPRRRRIRHRVEFTRTAGQYRVHVIPAPDGDCEITCATGPVRRIQLTQTQSIHEFRVPGCTSVHRSP